MKNHRSENAELKIRNDFSNQGIDLTSPEQLTASELISRCTNLRDEPAWQEFVRRFQPVISGVIVRSARRWTVPGPALIGDLMQMTYLKLCANNCKALREHDGLHENSIYGFLRVIASNVVSDYFRAHLAFKRGAGMVGSITEVALETARSTSHGASIAEQSVLFGEIVRCMRTITRGQNAERDAAIFMLYYREGLSAREISEIPPRGMGTKKVESILGRLTRRLRVELNFKQECT